MRNSSRFRFAALAAFSLSITPAVAQQPNPGFFVPPSAAPPTTRPATRPPQPRPQPAPQLIPPPALGIQPPPQQQTEAEPPPAPAQLPPVPDLPPLSRGAAPPASVIGVLGIPDIMRASLAAQQIEKVLSERREKLNADAQKEQAAWRDLQQQLANQRASLNAEQIRAKEKELQERITNAQKQFRDRNRIIQEAAQYGLAQIERMLIATIRQVAESRGMNLILHRAQVALNVNEFDITEQVVEQLNKSLPSVVLPPDGVAPSTFAPPAPPPAPVAQTPPTGTPTPTPTPTPVTAPTGGPPRPAPAPAPPRR